VTAGAGRYAPSPSSDLHLGNLRTAVVAYLAARSEGLSFRLRIDDLDERRRAEIAERQLADLSALGIVWDGPVMFASQRSAAHQGAVAALTARGLTYECFCSRREILEAPRAPHAPPGVYPGTCRDLTPSQVAAKRALKPGAVRLRADVAEWEVADRWAGRSRQPVDDFVLRRADGAIAYNLAVVVDDAAQAVTQVVRGDDLLASSGRQAYLARLLGLDPVEYAHVPLVFNRDGQRLSKRDGALAGAALFEGWGGVRGVLGGIGRSMGLVGPGEPATMELLASRFDLDGARLAEWTV
jgi:glutamyl-tRNA synthetase